MRNCNYCHTGTVPLLYNEPRATHRVPPLASSLEAANFLSTLWFFILVITRISPRMPKGHCPSPRFCTGMVDERIQLAVQLIDTIVP